MDTLFMKYSNYKLDDFLTDEFFRSWVINPSKESDFFWTSFINNNPEKYSTVLNAKEIILSLKSSSPQDQLSAEEIDSMFDNILNDSTRSGVIAKPGINWGPLHIDSGFIKVAAVIFVISFLGISWFVNRHKVTSDIARIVEPITKETSKGEKMTMRLPDNSVVVLNSNSRIEYPSSFSEEERRLTLHGEAFFDVSEDKDRPFIVESDQFYTRVLGTSFAVNKDPDINAIEVSVLTGKVEVAHVSDRNEIKKIELREEQMVSFQEDEFELRPFDYRMRFAWKDGTLYFKNSDFNEIVQKLENWYGVNIIIHRSIDRKKDFSGQFTNEPLDLVLNGLSFTYDFDYQINGKNIIIK
ncbi:MAG: FecR family protein [Cytophagales bacterium]|nr:FecR family protein [Cytophagales bacterium]